MIPKTVVLALALTSGAAQLTPVPTPAPGVTHVVGEVVLANSPLVLARQEGRWTVDCRLPERRATNDAELGPVVQEGHRYTIVFNGGVKEDHVTVKNKLQDGWFAAEGRGNFNLANAISVTEER